jgi:4-hydroxy-tetrahydrodipicolinate synthase
VEVRLNLHGTVIPAVPVPFSPRGQIDPSAQGRYVDWMSRQKVGGVAIWAHTGRGLRLNDDQRSEVLAAWKQGLHATPIVCGVGVPHGVRIPAGAAARTDAVIAHAVRLAGMARDGGAAAVMIHPPAALASLRGANRRVVALHQAVAEAGLPVIAFYLYEAASGLAYSAELVGAILQVPGVIGIKLATLDSVMTFQDLVRVVRAVPDRLLITGEDRFLGYSLMMGADAALIGMAAACTDAMVELLDAWFAGDLARFKKQSERVDRFGAETFAAPMEGYVQRMLWALEADGVLERPALDPFAPRMPASERDRVRQAVASLRAR